LKKYRIGIVGATGAVGQEIISLLEKRDFPVGDLKLLASSRSAGKEMKAFGTNNEVLETTPESFDGLDFAIFSAGGDNSVKFAHEAVKRGCVVIDNSSSFRMDPDVPLVVPEINADALESHSGIIANPNCSSAVALMALYPLHRRFGLKRFVASTYQAVSGAGAAGPVSLDQEIREKNSSTLLSDKIESAFVHPIAFNLIPHIDQFREDGYTKEELKMKNESRKILGLADLKVSCTCVRVPVYRAHSISINAEFKSGVNLPDAREALQQFKGLDFMDDPQKNLYPMPIHCSEVENCQVGRLRVDHALDNGLAFWVVGDQLWKGAALNAIQIAESMIERKCLRFIK
jgi:aspartate-semialdehyde dehydrogenase